MKNTFLVEKSLKVETTTKRRDLKGSKVFFDIEEDIYTSFIEVYVIGEKLPYLVQRNTLKNMINEGGLVESQEEACYTNHSTNPTNGKTPITHDNLINVGFEKRANIYHRENETVYLRQGHTWTHCFVGEKWNKDVKYIEDLDREFQW